MPRIRSSSPAPRPRRSSANASSRCSAASSSCRRSELAAPKPSPRAARRWRIPHTRSMDERIYKLVPAEAWSVRGDRVPAAEVDRRDGYVHFSSAAQLRETADKHFRTGGDTWLLEVDAHALPEGTL